MRNWVARLWDGLRYTEMAIGFISIVLGTGFLLRLHMFSQGLVMMTPFISIGPEWIWGVWFVLGGSLKIVGRLGGYRRMRLIGTIMSVLGWTAGLVAICRMSPQALGIPVFGAIVALSAAEHIRIGTTVDEQ